MDSQTLFGMKPTGRRSALDPSIEQPPSYDAGRLAGNPEEDERDRILAIHEYTNGQILDELRVCMIKLYSERRAKQGADAYVTADDARVILDSDPKYPGPDKLNRNFMGQLFQSKTNGKRDWEWNNMYVKSKTAGSHANPVKCWRWVGWMNRGAE